MTKLDGFSGRGKTGGWMIRGGVATALLCITSLARAIVIDFESASGYQLGNLYNQPGTVGATKWGANPNGMNYPLLQVVANEGVGGSQGLMAQANASVAASVYQFNPSNADLGGVFSNTSSQIAFSFNLNWESLGATGTYTGRFFVGNTLSSQAGDVLRLSWSSDGRMIYTLSGGTSKFVTTASGSNFYATANTFYTISGVLNYATGTYQLYVNGVQQVDASLSANISFVNPAGANVNSNFELQTQLNNDANFRPWTIDNINYALVPEPASIALVLGGLSFMVLMRRCSRRK